MKTFTNLMESCVTADVNQGNSLQNTLGVTNHLTPINNIVTNVKNLFSGLPIVVSVAEDGCSIKVNSSEFTSKQNVEKVLFNPYYNNRLSVLTYIMQQGLSFVKLVNLGQFYVVYVCPADMKQAQPTIDGTGIEPEPAKVPCKEQLDEEVELDTLVVESDDDKELKDITKEKLSEIISSKDKVKGAKQMELLVSQSMELPREYYFAGVKDKDGEESIALRWKYQKKRRKNRTAEATRSLVNIYDETKDGVWVQDFVKDSLFKVPEEVEKLIKNLLELIGAVETDDPAVWSLESKSDDKKDDKKDDDKKEDSSSKSSDDDDSEDDSSRGDDSDLLK